MSGAEALALVGLAGNVVQFVSSAQQGLSYARELYHNGSLAENSEMEKITRYSLETFSILKENVNPSSGLTTRKEDQEIFQECENVSRELLNLLNDLKPDNRKSQWREAASKSVRTMRARSKIKDLEKRLRRLREMICLRLNVVLL